MGKDLLRAQDAGLGFLELGRDIARGVGERLPDQVVGWQDVARSSPAVARSFSAAARAAALISM